MSNWRTRGRALSIAQQRTLRYPASIVHTYGVNCCPLRPLAATANQLQTRVWSSRRICPTNAKPYFWGTSRGIGFAFVPTKLSSRSFTSDASPQQGEVRRLSSLLAPRTIEAPSEEHASVASHRLMIQAGLMRQCSRGIYTLLPLGLRTLEKIIGIIDQEMAAIHGQKLQMPLLLPSSIWKASGRWEEAGPEMFRLKDRKGSDYCLAPTHEELITQLFANEMISPRQLPMKLYQIGIKYRDEPRPRHGLMRGREFLMKDMYSFDLTPEDALKTYKQVLNAYKRIFDRLKLPYVVAHADSGNIGGDLSHEFQIVSEMGEDTVLKCNQCNYAANVEKARGKVDDNGNHGVKISSEEVERSLEVEELMKSSESVNNNENIEKNIGKNMENMEMKNNGNKKNMDNMSITMSVVNDGGMSNRVFLLVGLRQRPMNPLKVKAFLQKNENILSIGGGGTDSSISNSSPSDSTNRITTSNPSNNNINEEISSNFDKSPNTSFATSTSSTSTPSFSPSPSSSFVLYNLNVAPLNSQEGKQYFSREHLLKQPKLSVLVDEVLLKKDTETERRLTEIAIASKLKRYCSKLSFIDFYWNDFTLTREKDKCAEPGCTGTLAQSTGIEVGHIFYLGTKYSSKLNAKIQHSGGGSGSSSSSSSSSQGQTDKEKQVKTFVEMGCYGLGVTRILASIIETSHDEHGIIWPSAVAPYKVLVLSLATAKDPELNQIAVQVCQSLEAHNHLLKGEVLLDDRKDVQPGFKMREAQLLGFPWVVVVGRSLRQENKLEVQVRKDNTKVFVPPSEIVAYFEKAIKEQEIV